jgi:transcriptional regulator GlxA family with amidase domain
LEPAPDIQFLSLAGGIVHSSQQVPVQTREWRSATVGEEDILLVPGGPGIRTEGANEAFLKILRTLAPQSCFTLSVCTGSYLLAKAGLLNGRRATSNKRLFPFVSQQNNLVEWIKKARWVKDGNIYTSSGISAGMDMALGFIADQYGRETAEAIANRIEYVWNDDREFDPFSELY